VKIRDLRKTDAEIIIREEIAQGWNQTIDKYLTRLMHQEKDSVFRLSQNMRERLPVISMFIQSPLKARMEIREFRKSWVLEYWKNSVAAGSVRF